MIRRIGIVLAAAALQVAPGPLAAQTAYRAPSNLRPVINGTFTDAAGGAGSFSGSIRLTGFEVRNGVVVALGRLTGALADSGGTPIGRLDENLALPVSSASSACELLRLELGPAEVDASSGRIQIQKDVLGITTKDGPPRQLLCALGDLLNQHAKADAVAVALNQVLTSMADR